MRLQPIEMEGAPKRVPPRIFALRSGARVATVPPDLVAQIGAATEMGSRKIWDASIIAIVGRYFNVSMADAIEIINKVSYALSINKSALWYWEE